MHCAYSEAEAAIAALEVDQIDTGKTSQLKLA